MKTIGERIKERRLARGMTGMALAKAAGIAASTLTELERGDSKGSKHLHRIAAALGVDPAELDPPRGRRSQGDAAGKLPTAHSQQVVDPIHKNDANGSRLERLDPVMIRECFDTVNVFFTRYGVGLDMAQDADLFARTYEFCLSGDSAILEEVEAIAELRAKRRGVAEGEQDKADEKRRARRPGTRK
jgi:transcriptional regulator with XRE-family HTH domain